MKTFTFTDAELETIASALQAEIELRSADAKDPNFDQEERAEYRAALHKAQQLDDRMNGLTPGLERARVIAFIEGGILQEAVVPEGVELLCIDLDSDSENPMSCTMHWHDGRGDSPSEEDCAALVVAHYEEDFEL